MPAGGWTGKHLHVAASRGRAERLARMLLRGGIELEWGTKYRETALFAAAEQGHTECVVQLVKAGARIEAKTEHGATPLLAAVYWGHEGACRALLDAGADFEATTSNERTMEALAFCADQRTIEKLLRRAARRKANSARLARGEAVEEEWLSEAEEGAESDMPPHIREWATAEMEKLGLIRHFTLLH
eukprot:5148459-Prymnesium_polylepis.1